MTAAVAEYVYPLVMPWGAIVDDLYRRGYTDYRIGQILGVDAATVGAWHKGSEPRHSFGEALIELHTKVCGEALTKERLKEARPRE